MLRNFLLYLFGWEFLSWKDVKLCHTVFCIYWDDHLVFTFHSVKLVYHIGLRMLNQSCILGINQTWSWYLIGLTCYWEGLVLSLSREVKVHFMILLSLSVLWWLELNRIFYNPVVKLCITTLFSFVRIWKSWTWHFILIFV